MLQRQKAESSLRWILAATFGLLLSSQAIAQDVQDVQTQPPKSNPDSVVVAKSENAEASNSDLNFLFDGTNPVSLNQLRQMQTQVKAITKKVVDATVNIRVGDAQGTGILVTRDGYILTAAHVIAQPDLDARIILADGREFRARTLGLNRAFDSGMLKVNVDESLPYIEMDQSNKLSQGQWVVAIGHPGGLDKDRGLVLRLGRLLNSTRSVLKTDCVLVGGDSGGPLVNLNGDLIGVHSRIGTQLWDNIHVPIDVFSDEWDRLAAGEIVGQDPSPYIGVNVVDDTNKVSSVLKDSPAEKAGILVDDVVIKIADREIKNKKDMSDAFNQFKIDEEIAVVVQRGSDQLTLSVKVGKTWR